MVAITKDYLGPAAKRFIDRQISFHLNKGSNELTKDEVRRLAEHLGVALQMLTNDKKAVEEAVRRIKDQVK